MIEPYGYRAVVARVVDGDTLDVEIDLGFRTCARHRCRLYGYNAPELTGPERPLGALAGDFLEALLPAGAPVMVRTHKADGFGRYLVEVEYEGRDLVTALVAQGWGVRWDGRSTRPAFDPLAPYPLG